MTLIALAAALTLAPSVTLNQAPTSGATVTFTEVVPREALVSSRKPQFPFNPQTQINCGAWVEVTTYVSKRNLGDGYTELQTGPVTLPTGPTSCTAVVASWSQKNGQVILTSWASTYFDIT